MSDATTTLLTTSITSSNLYLITFLATLFLLLFISTAIILRSILRRRRFQRHLDNALAAGFVLGPRTRKRPHRPKFFTACVVPGGDKWHQMNPVAALPVQAKRRSKPTPTDSNAASETPSPPLRQRILSLRRADPTADDHKVPPKPTRVRVDMLQISVLIAMPSPRRPAPPLTDSSSSIAKHPHDADHIPHVVFGVTRLPFKHTAPAPAPASDPDPDPVEPPEPIRIPAMPTVPAYLH